MNLRPSVAALCVLCATLAASASAGGEKKLVTVDDLMGLRTVNDVRISPDGRHVAYTVSTPSYDTDSHETVLYVVATASGDGSSGTPTRLTYATTILNRPLPNPSLRWSPDGRTISFLSPVQGMPQVMGIGTNGGEARTLTTAKGGVIAYEWSPDGRHLAFVSGDPASDEETRQRRDKTFVIQVDRQDRPVRLWRQPVEGGAPQSLTPPEQFVSGLSWSPDGATIAYSVSLTTGFMATYNSRIYTVPAAGGTPRTVVDRPGMNVGPKFSPDGRWIAFTSTDGRAAMISTWGLHTVRADGGEIRNLSTKNETWAGDYLWLPDARSLFLLPEEGTVRRGARMFDRPVVRVSAATGDSEVLTAPDTVAYSPSLSVDGRLLAYRSVEPRTMGDVVVMDVATRRVTRLTDVNPQLKDLALGDIRAIGWKSFDGMEIWGLLLTPPGYRPGTRVPLVVYAHGGPIGGFTHGIFPQFMHRIGQVDLYPTDAMASAGMAVLFPMPRGGAGYGEAGFRMIVKRWGEDDYKDIMAGVDHVIALGIADPEKLGVMGASYGGFMTSWIVTQTNRFKAASTGASVVDLAALYYQSDAGEVTKEYFGLPWENRDLYAQHSPLTHAANVKTPLLIQHGENDRRVPVSQSTSLYRALKAHGAHVELDIYPGGSHVLYEPDLERVQMQRNLDWFKKWLSPAPAQITR